MHRRPGPIGIAAALALWLTLALALLLTPAAGAAGALGSQDGGANLGPAGTASPAAMLASVSGAPAGAPIAPGFVGVSFEYQALHLYTGRYPYPVNPVLVALLRALAPGQSPVLRVGGNSTDTTWWPMRGVIPSRGISYSLTNGWLRTTRALASALNARLILGVNLAAGRPAIAAAEARAFLQGIGRRYIQTLEIGNEADVYGMLPYYFGKDGLAVDARSPGWNLGAFTDEFTRWRAALPRVPVAGPAFAELTWLNGLGAFLAAEPGLALATAHRYPLRGCLSNPTDPSYASIANLLDDASSSGLAQNIVPYAAVARARGVPLRIDEMNSVACSGTRGVSDTFASALWVLDTLFNMAHAGVEGVNLHTLQGARYEPFTFKRSGRHWSAFVHPEYYGMLMFAQAAPPGSKLLSVTTSAGPVKVWATRGTDGKIRVVLINKDPSAAHDVLIRTPRTGVAALERLQAPSVSATAGVSLGGQSFGQRTDTGMLGRPTSTAVQPSGDAYSIELPAASAALLTQ